MMTDQKLHRRPEVLIACFAGMPNAEDDELIGSGSMYVPNYIIGSTERDDQFAGVGHACLSAAFREMIERFNSGNESSHSAGGRARIFVGEEGMKSLEVGERRPGDD
jgi:hypothetical protein